MVGLWLGIAAAFFVAGALMVFVNLASVDSGTLPFSGFVVGLVAAAGVLAIVMAVFEARDARGRRPESRRRGSKARF